MPWLSAMIWSLTAASIGPCTWSSSSARASLWPSPESRRGTRRDFVGASPVARAHRASVDEVSPSRRGGGLGQSDARALLLDHVQGPIDAAVSDQIIAESHGIPLALLELPRPALRQQGRYEVPCGRTREAASRAFQFPECRRVRSARRCGTGVIYVLHDATKPEIYGGLPATRTSHGR